MTARRLIIADPGLRSALGHHFGYSMAVAEAARARGLSPLVLAAARFEGGMPPAIECRPIFSAAYQAAGGGGRGRAMLFGLASRLPDSLARCVAPPLRMLRRRLHRPVADGFAAELAQALTGQTLTNADILLLHSVSAANLAGLLDVSLPGVLAIVLRRQPQDMDRDDRGPEPVAVLLRRLATRLGPRLRLFADTAELAAEWRSTLQRPVRELPLPVVTPAIRASLPRPVPNLVFAGGARIEKGYTLLPALVRQLAGQARFIIHSGPVGPADDPLIQRAHAALRTHTDEGVRLLERSLDPEEYLALLEAADLLLLPYNATTYGPRSSHVLAEARAMGVPAVVPAGCWMGAQVGPDQSLVFTAPAHFVPTVAAALPRLPELSALYRAAAPEWRTRHCPQALLDCLLAPGEAESSIEYR